MAKLQKRTRWFTIGKHGTPALPGWYEGQYWQGDADTRMRRWDGKHWWLECGVMAAFGLGRHHRWRGLAEDPSKAPAQEPGEQKGQSNE